MKSIEQFAFSLSGGAGSVAVALNAGFRSAGMRSTLRFANELNLRERPSPTGVLIHSALDEFVVKNNSSQSQFSLLRDSESRGRIDASSDTIYVFHWTPGLVSTDEIWTLADNGGKVVIVLHDYFFLTGGCHYPGRCERFLSTCSSCPMARSAFHKRVSRSKLSKQKIVSHPNVSIVSPSEALASVSRKLVRDMKVIRNPIHQDWFANHPATYNPESGDVFFVAERLLDSRKGLDSARSWINEKRRELGPLRMNLVGEIPRRFVLQGEKAHGRLSRDELIGLYRSLKPRFLLVASEAEIYTNTITEAASQCIPAIIINRPDWFSKDYSESTGQIVLQTRGYPLSGKCWESLSSSAVSWSKGHSISSVSREYITLFEEGIV